MTKKKKKEIKKALEGGHLICLEVKKSQSNSKIAEFKYRRKGWERQKGSKP